MKYKRKMTHEVHLFIFAILVIASISFVQAQNNIAPAARLFQSEIRPISVTMAGNILNSYTDNISAAMYEQPELNIELGGIEKRVPGWYFIPSLMFIKKRKWDGDRFWAGIAENELYVAYVPITNTDNIYERDSLVIFKKDGKEYIADTIKLLVSDNGAVYYGGLVPGAPIEEASGEWWISIVPFVFFAVVVAYILKKRKRAQSFISAQQ